MATAAMVLVSVLLYGCGRVGTTINGDPAPFAIMTTALPPAQAGSPYSATLQASGGTAPYTWSLARGTLPQGLLLNTSSGTVSGTPGITAPATVTLTFSAMDSASPAQSVTATVSLNIKPKKLRVLTTSLPGGTAGVPYSATLSAIGGVLPYTWTLVSGTLPAGLTLNATTGAITGNPAPAAGDQLTFQVGDSETPVQTSTVTVALNITPTSGALNVTTTSLPGGQVGVAYATTLTAAGGTPPYTWALTKGVLPAGLSLNPATGVISGTPTAAASAVALSFKVTDSGTFTQSNTGTFSLTIAPATLRITSASLPNGQVGIAYAATLSASGGTVPYQWTLVSGTLPAGLILNAATGAISGTPTAAVSGASLTFKVTDAGTPAQSASVALTLTITPATLRITTASLPNGQVGVAYTATLAATGGTTPYKWTLTAGILPAGLTLNAATGSITGTPSATASATSLTFKLTDSGMPAQSQSTTLLLTISPAGTISVSIAPARAALAINQTLHVSATTNDAAGVTWRLTPAGGSINPATSTSGVSVTLTAPATAGVYTLTATSVTDKTKNASISVAVTDLPGVFTYHNDLARDGANAQEYALTSSNVNTTTFGKLFSCAVDGAIYAQPLWVANLTVAGAKHNVLIVATQHDSLYAIDADASPCTQLWHMNLIDTSHGGTAGETPVSSSQVGAGAGDIAPEVGITSTPVIDPAAGIVYLVSKSVNSAGTAFYERLHAIDVVTGNEKPGSPVTIAATYPGTGDGGTVVTFNTRQQNQRAGLALVNGTVYVGAGSHADLLPFHGWLLGYRYSGSAFTQTAVYCTTPNAGPSTYGAGIWMSGGAPAADSNGHLYVITGNGLFDANSASAPNNDYGDSFLQLAAGLTVSSYFTVTNQASDAINDYDVGSGGAAMVINLASGSPSHLVVGGGKEGYLYLLDGDNMGGLGDANARQRLTLTYAIFSTAAFWNNTLYLGGVTTPLQSFTFNPTTKLLASAPTSQTPERFIFPTATPSVSAAGSASNGIVWLMDNAPYCTSQSTSCGPTVLHAYNAANLASELWNSSMVAGDVAGYAVKFTVPTVANGKVYIGTRGNNIGGADGSTSVPGEVDVYGLKP